MNTVKINSNAKVNIGLKVLSLRKDGYHDIVTIFQEINLFDIIYISINPLGCNFNSNVNWLINDKSNLCITAYEAMKKIFDINGINIDLTKNIPRGSGLGGGSSNAASVLKGIRQLYNLDISDNELENIAAEIGADVPFFIRGSIQLGEGVGDRLTPLKININGKYLIIIPEIIINTFWAYSQFKKNLDSSLSSINFAGLSIGKTISLDMLKLFENDFESIVVPTYPEIGEIKEKLHALGARYASLSGSGSTVFGIFNDDVSLNNAFSYFSPKYKTFITNPL
jgi:4-diphosphocytidyl-2-C-methyl-D-erythritol kinase